MIVRGVLYIDRKMYEWMDDWKTEGREGNLGRHVAKSGMDRIPLGVD